MDNKFNEIKDRLNGKGVGIYDDVCRHHDIQWLTKQMSALDKLQYESARTEEIILTYAQKQGLNEFYSKWSNKLYSDSDHNIPNMILDFIEALER